MILNYTRFNESYEEFKMYDRVKCHGILRHYDEENNNGYFNVDIEGQTGIIDHLRGYGRNAGVVFDNYFVPFLTDLQKNLLIKRGFFVPTNQLEKIASRPIKEEGTSLMQMSRKMKIVLEKCDYIDCPIYTNINFIDITDRNDTISYISQDRIARVPDDDDIWKSNLRQEMRIGRFFQIINPYTNQITLDRKINRYKSTYNDIILRKYEFQVVVGQDIIKWYRGNNYQEGNGSLNKSCMRNQDERLQLYANNQDKISLLIMVNDDNKLLGRAIVWKVDDPEIIYMDRPYTVYQEDSVKFDDFAYSQGWKYFEVDRGRKMTVYLNRNYGPDTNPYMDTFSYFYTHWNNKNYYLTNRSDGGEMDEDYYRYDEP
jgi:hypothetical protein